MSLVASTKAVECRRTNKNGMHTGTWCSLYCAREQISTLCSGTGTVVTCFRRSDSGARRYVRERGKNKKEERERERGGNGVPLFSPPVSPHRFFFLSSAHISLRTPHDLNTWNRPAHFRNSSLGT